MFLQPRGEGVARVVVTDVVRVFAAQRPLGRDAKRSTDLGRRPFNERGLTDGVVHEASFLRVPVATARTSRRAVADGVDEGPTNRLVEHGVGRQIELQQAHRTLDVDADGAGVDVRGGDHHAAHGGAVAAVGVGIEDEIGHAGGEPRVDRLLQAHVVKRAADGLGADDGDRPGLAARGEHGGGVGRGDEFQRHRALAGSRERDFGNQRGERGSRFAENSASPRAHVDVRGTFPQHAGRTAVCSRTKFLSLDHSLRIDPFSEHTRFP